MRLGDYNLGHNILEPYNVLIETRLTTSKTKRDIQYGKRGIGIVSRVPERPNTQEISQEIRKYQENLKFQWRHSPAPRKSNPGSNSKKTRKSRYQTPPSISPSHLKPPSQDRTPRHPSAPKKALHEVKASGLQLNFNIFPQPPAWTNIKNSLHKPLQTIESLIH